MRTIPALAAACCFAGCAKMEAKVAPDTVSLADRCGLIMQAAMPFAQLDLGDRSAHSPDVRTIVTQVTATRTDVPKAATGERDLAAECTFVDDVLAGFRWTKGGPQSPAGEQASPGADTLPATTPPSANPPHPRGKTTTSR